MNDLLPPGRFFAVWRLAEIFSVSRDHVWNLVLDGEFEGVDARRRGCSRYSVLIPRASVIEFLERRKIVVNQNGNGTNGRAK